MYRQKNVSAPGFGPEYIEREQFGKGYPEDEGLDLSEAAASEIYEWSETLAEMTEDMDDDELAEFAEELMDDEFWGALISAVAPLAMKLGGKIVGAIRKRRRRRRRRTPVQNRAALHPQDWRRVSATRRARIAYPNRNRRS